MDDNFLKVVPVIVFFALTILLAFLVLLTPVITNAYAPIDASIIIVGMLSVVAITSATVGLIVHKFLFAEHGHYDIADNPHGSAAKKKRGQNTA